MNAGPTCGCRGCTKAYEEGYLAAQDGFMQRIREARRQAYRNGYNDGVRCKIEGDWLFGRLT